MSKTEAMKKTGTTATEADPVTRIDALLARIDARLANLTEEERRSLAERLAQEVEAGIRERVQRGDPV